MRLVQVEAKVNSSTCLQVVTSIYSRDELAVANLAVKVRLRTQKLRDRDGRMNHRVWEGL